MRELLFVEHGGDIVAQGLADRFAADDDLADVRFSADGGAHRLGVAAADQLDLALRQALAQPGGHFRELLREELVGPRIGLEAGLHVGLAICHLDGVQVRQHARFDTQLPADADVAPVIAERDAEVGAFGRGGLGRPSGVSQQRPGHRAPKPSGNAHLKEATS